MNLSQDQLAQLLPTAEEADENVVGRGLGHFTRGPVTNKRYGSAALIGKATGQAVPHLIKSPGLSDLWTTALGSAIGVAGSAAHPDFKNWNPLQKWQTLTAGATSGGAVAKLLTSVLRARGVAKIREGAERAESDLKVDPFTALSSRWRTSGGDFDRGVVNAYKVLHGGQVNHRDRGDHIRRVINSVPILKSLGRSTSLIRKRRARRDLQELYDQHATTKAASHPMRTAIRFMSLVKAAAALSEEELAMLMPTKQEAGENSVARGFGHLLHGPVTSRRYGSARTVADATGQRTPFLNKHPRTGELLSVLTGAGVGAAGGMLGGEAVNLATNAGDSQKFTNNMAGGLAGAGLGAIVAKLMAARSRAKGVETIREGARHRPVDRSIDPEKSLPGMWQIGTGDYDRGVSDAHRVFQGGRSQRVRAGDSVVRLLRALSSTMGGTGVGEAAAVADLGGQMARKVRVRDDFDRTHWKSRDVALKAQ